MSNDSKQGGNKVNLATFEKWDKDRGLKEIFCFKTSTVDNCVYVTEVWCKVCAAQQHHFANHPNLKGQVLDSSVKRFIDGTMLKRVLLIDTWIHQWHIKLRWKTTNPVHHNVIKRYLFKYFLTQSCTQRSCAF